MDRRPGPRNILLTGGAGYIGSAVAHALVSRGYNVHVLDNLSRGDRAAVPSPSSFHQLHLHEELKIRRLLVGNKIDTVLHFAAFSRVAESIEYPELYFRNNTQGTLSLLKAMRGSLVKNFIFSSTAAVYGENSTGKVTENSPVSPKNPYGESKLRSEKEIQSFAAEVPDLNYIIFRYFNVAGADLEVNCGPRDPLATQLIRRGCRTLLGIDGSLEVFGSDYPTPDGTCVRDYIHVKDLVAAHVQAMLLCGTQKIRKILNLGYGRGFSVLETIKALEHVSGRQLDYRLGPRRTGDPSCVVADSKLAENTLALSWQHNDIMEICQDSYNWERRQFRGAKIA